MFVMTLTVSSQLIFENWHHREIIRQNVFKEEWDYLFNVGMTEGLKIYVINIFNLNWRYKTSFRFIVTLINISMFGKMGLVLYWRNTIVRVVWQSILAHNNYLYVDQLRDVLKMQQNKLKEDLYWKKLIDEFSEGIIIVDKNKTISYKNNPVTEIFRITDNELINPIKTSMQIKEIELFDKQALSDKNEESLK